MNKDGDKPKKRLFEDIAALAGALIATLTLLACTACNGFFVDPTLSSIQLTPAGATLLVGATKQYQAVGTYNDGSTKSISPVWTSSAPTAATISSGGLVKGIATGTATITATSGGVSGTTTLTVQSAPLQSITVTPANPSLSVGAGQAFTATGRNTDATTEDLTSVATWNSSSSTVASITSTGSATALAQGTTTIQATSGGISGSTILTVTK